MAPSDNQAANAASRRGGSAAHNRAYREAQAKQKADAKAARKAKKLAAKGADAVFAKKEQLLAELAALEPELAEQKTAERRRAQTKQSKRKHRQSTTTPKSRPKRERKSVENADMDGSGVTDPVRKVKRIKQSLKEQLTKGTDKKLQAQVLFELATDPNMKEQRDMAGLFSHLLTLKGQVGCIVPLFPELDFLASAPRLRTSPPHLASATTCQPPTSP